MFDLKTFFFYELIYSSYNTKSYFRYSILHFNFVSLHILLCGSSLLMHALEVSDVSRFHAKLMGRPYVEPHVGRMLGGVTTEVDNTGASQSSLPAPSLGMIIFPTTISSIVTSHTLTAFVSPSKISVSTMLLPFISNLDSYDFNQAVVSCFPILNLEF